MSGPHNHPTRPAMPAVSAPPRPPTLLEISSQLEQVTQMLASQAFSNTELHHRLERISSSVRTLAERQDTLERDVRSTRERAHRTSSNDAQQDAALAAVATKLDALSAQVASSPSDVAQATVKFLDEARAMLRRFGPIATLATIAASSLGTYFGGRATADEAAVRAAQLVTQPAPELSPAPEADAGSAPLTDAADAAEQD